MKFFTRLFILFLLIMFCNVYGQGGWKDVTPSDTYPGLLGVFALDSDNVWVVGQEGTILNTTNSGTTWSEIYCPETYSLYNVHFINADTGWVAGDDDSDTEVMRTMDRGSFWELQQLDNNDWGNNDIKFIEGDIGEPPVGFVTAGRALVWKTDDYGENWESTLGFGGCGASSIRSISFINKDEGWFVGEPALTMEVTIVHTTDGGETYEIQTNPTDPDIRLNSVCFADNQQGVAVGVSGIILYTSDGGQNWEERTFDLNRWQSVFLTQSGKAWAVGEQGSIFYSTDWGYNWTPQQSGVTCELWEVFFINDNEGWIVGGGIGKPGVILHTTTGGVVTDVKEGNIIRKFELYQNYPNPFNPVTVIKYEIQSLNYVTLGVYDVLGNKVAVIVDEEQSAGDYEYEFNAEKLSSGVYYYKLKAGDYSVTKKMLLLK